MSPAFPSRRRADEFHRLLEGDAPSGGATELTQLADLVTRLRAEPVVTPRPAFSSDLRSRLVAAAAAQAGSPDPVDDKLTVGHELSSDARRRRQRWLTGALAALVVVGGSASTAYASQQALPGDTLYPVKRAIEGIDAGLATSDRDRGVTVLHDAEGRLREVRRLSERRRPDPERVAAALSTYEEQADRASELLLRDDDGAPDPEAVARLRDFTTDGVRRLTELDAVLPEQALSKLTDAADALLAIDQRIDKVCPSCGGGIDELPSTLLDNAFGPVVSSEEGVRSSPRKGAPSASPKVSLPGDVPPGVPGTVDDSPSPEGSTPPSSDAPSGVPDGSRPSDGGLVPDGQGLVPKKGDGPVRKMVKHVVEQVRQAVDDVTGRLPTQR